jgi:hypothetical protein
MSRTLTSPTTGPKILSSSLLQLMPMANISIAPKHKKKLFFIFVVILFAKIHLILYIKARKDANLA